MADVDFFVGPLVRDPNGNLAVMTYFVGVDNEAEIKEAYEASVNAVTAAGFSLVKEIGGSNSGNSGVSGTYTREGRKYHNREIQTLVRRQQRNRNDSGEVVVTPVIDAYAPWYESEDGKKTYGQFPEFRSYLNTEDDVAHFETFFGVKIEDMELYQGQQAPKRTGFEEPWEMTLESPVYAECYWKPRMNPDTDQIEKDDEGKPMFSRRFSRWLSGDEAEQARQRLIASRGSNNN